MVVLFTLFTLPQLKHTPRMCKIATKLTQMLKPVLVVYLQLRKFQQQSTALAIAYTFQGHKNLYVIQFFLLFSIFGAYFRRLRF